MFLKVLGKLNRSLCSLPFFQLCGFSYFFLNLSFTFEKVSLKSSGLIYWGLLCFGFPKNGSLHCVGTDDTGLSGHKEPDLQERTYFSSVERLLISIDLHCTHSSRNAVL